jgi:hypothetical protein
VVPVDALQLDELLVPMAGRWAERDGRRRFTPSFAPIPGAEYAVARRAASGRWGAIAHAVVPLGPGTPSTTVTSIAPVVGEVPANLLRLRISFSAPIAEGSAEGGIALLDEAGAELLGAMLPMPPELWDRDRRELTVLLEPGRLKRGLRPHEEAGLPLAEGSVVTAMVAASLRDATGMQLASGASRSYRVGPPIRSRIDPATWSIRWPDPEDRRLVVRFDRPLDDVLARRCIRFVDADDVTLPGRVEVDPTAMTWTHIADAAAPRGARLAIDTRLEDLAGNSLRRAFDTDFEEAGTRLDARTVTLTP